MKDKADLINFIIEENGYQSYLEIGVQRGDTFKRIRAPIKECIDPKSDYPATFRMTSDDFFKTQKTYKQYDVVLVDGMHLREVVIRDIINSFQYLKPKYIVVHDCNPTTEQMQMRERPTWPRPWTGDVWKAWIHLRRTRFDFKMFVVDIDFGCGIITKGGAGALDISPHSMTWENFKKYKEEWLKLRDVESFKKFVRAKGGID